MRTTTTLLSRITAGLLLAIVLIPLAATSASAATPRTTRARAVRLDALRLRKVRELDAWIGWLKSNNASGFVGEVGWPDDDPRWNTLADTWFTHADAAGLGVSTWVSGEWAGDLQLGGYVRSSYATQTVDTARANARIAESHFGAAALRGVNTTGPEMGAAAVEPTSTFSNTNAGWLDHTYHYDNAKSYAFLAGRGVKVVRLPIRWERIQRSLYAPLDAAEMARVLAAVRAARSAGLQVIIDLHNYAGYYLQDPVTGLGVRQSIGSAALPVTAFTDVWAKIAGFFAAEDSVVGFDLMNEPTNMADRGTTSAARVWELASQQAVNVIRATGDTRTIMVAGYHWSSMAAWITTHPVAWIKDPLKNIRYEAHQYFDAKNSGVYRGYDEEVAAVAGR